MTDFRVCHRQDDPCPLGQLRWARSSPPGGDANQFTHRANRGNRSAREKRDTRGHGRLGPRTQADRCLPVSDTLPGCRNRNSLSLPKNHGGITRNHEGARWPHCWEPRGGATSAEIHSASGPDGTHGRHSVCVCRCLTRSPSRHATRSGATVPHEAPAAARGGPAGLRRGGLVSRPQPRTRKSEKCSLFSVGGRLPGARPTWSPGRPHQA